MIGTNTVEIKLNMKFFTVTHHHKVEFGSGAFNCSLIGVILSSRAEL
jgi:hypothetical protein